MKALIENGLLKVVQDYFTVPAYEVANDYESQTELFWKSGIEFVEMVEPDSAVMHAIRESYNSVDVQMIIRVNGQLYRSKGTYSSYGYDEWSLWEPVQQKQKTVTYYE